MKKERNIRSFFDCQPVFRPYLTRARPVFVVLVIFVVFLWRLGVFLLLRLRPFLLLWLSLLLWPLLLRWLLLWWPFLLWWPLHLLPSLLVGFLLLYLPLLLRSLLVDVRAFLLLTRLRPRFDVWSGCRRLSSWRPIVRRARLRHRARLWRTTHGGIIRIRI